MSVLVRRYAMAKRLFTLAVLMGVLLLTIAACGGDDNGDSGAETTKTEATKPPEKKGASGGLVLGTPVPVVNEDPAGSGEYRFNPSQFVFTTGDTVTFQLTAETELHNFSAEGLEIDVDIDGAANPGAEQALVFTFNDPGTYRLFCLYHEAQGMVGTITVSD